MPGECMRPAIHDLAETCDNEYYMSALPPDLGGQSGRTRRGRARLVAAISEFEHLRTIVPCIACQAEIAAQLALQADAVREIDQVWTGRLA